MSIILTTFFFIPANFLGSFLIADFVNENLFKNEGKTSFFISFLKKIFYSIFSLSLGYSARYLSGIDDPAQFLYGYKWSSFVEEPGKHSLLFSHVKQREILFETHIVLLIRIGTKSTSYGRFDILPPSSSNFASRSFFVRAEKI